MGDADLSTQRPLPKHSRLPWFPRRFSLRGKLMLLILSALIPLMLLQFVEVWAQFHERTEEEISANVELARATGAAFMNFVKNVWNAESAIGSAIFVHDTPMSAQDARSLMLEQVKNHKAVDVLSWLSPDGVVIASTQAQSVGVSLADRDHIRRIQRGEEAVVSDLLPSGRIVSGSAVGIARGIRKNGQLRGIILASVKPGRLYTVLPFRRGGHGGFGLIDRNGRMVYRGIGESSNHATITPETPAWKALRGSVASSPRFVSAVGGSVRMGAAVPIRPIGWAASATVPVKQAYASAWESAYMDILSVAAVMLASLFIGGITLTGILRHVAAWRESALAIAEGDFSVRVNLPGSNEVLAANSAFNSMAARIQELERARTRFIQIAAHELRTPMTSISGICSILSDSFETGAPLPEAGKLAQILRQEMTHLSSLVSQILDSFLIQEGRLSLKADPVNLVEVATHSAAPILASGRSIRLDLPDSSSPVVVSGDPLRLGQVIRNLISNAVKYSPDDSEILLRLSTRDDRAVLSVTDLGPGIPVDHLDRIFEPFHRVGGANPQWEVEGIGLGLYICKDIVERHGGKIWVESALGQGSTFFVELPLARSERRP